MGVVYEAIDGHLDRAIALKLLPHDAVTNPSHKRRFVQEAKSASALKISQGFSRRPLVPLLECGRPHLRDHAG
jgi:hypothetical protein